MVKLGTEDSWSLCYSWSWPHPADDLVVGAYPGLLFHETEIAAQIMQLARNEANRDHPEILHVDRAYYPESCKFSGCLFEWAFDADLSYQGWLGISRGPVASMSSFTQHESGMETQETGESAFVMWSFE